MNLASGARGVKRKNGQLDDAVVLGAFGRPWISGVMRAFVSLCSEGEPIFPLTFRQYEMSLAQAASALSFDHLGIGPHAVRHSGPSHDMTGGTTLPPAAMS